MAIQLFWVVLGRGQQYPVCLMLVTKYTERFTEIPTLWGNREVAMPTSAVDGRVRGHVPLKKILRCVPIRCHYVHFKITVLPRPKLLQAHSKMPKGQKKNWLGRVSKTGKMLSKNGMLEIFDENGRFPAETKGLESLGLNE